MRGTNGEGETSIPGKARNSRSPAAQPARITVRVQPRASRSEIVGFDSTGVLRVRVTAPPVGGEANKAVIGLLADVLGVPKSNVTIARGQSGRQKLVDITDLSLDEIRRRLAAAAG